MTLPEAIAELQALRMDNHALIDELSDTEVLSPEERAQVRGDVAELVRLEQAIDTVLAELEQR
jgi:hypothetical protein